MQKKKIFKSVLIGGYDKEDVLSYVQAILKESSEEKEKFEKERKEQQEKIQELNREQEALLEQARQEADAIMKAAREQAQQIVSNCGIQVNALREAMEQSIQQISAIEMDMQNTNV